MSLVFGPPRAHCTRGITFGIGGAAGTGFGIAMGGEGDRAGGEEEGPASAGQIGSGRPPTCGAVWQPATASSPRTRNPRREHEPACTSSGVRSGRPPEEARVAGVAEVMGECSERRHGACAVAAHRRKVSSVAGATLHYNFACAAITTRFVPTTHLVILSRESSRNGELAPIAPRAELVRQLLDRNTGPEREGDDVLYGPGIEIQLPPGQDPIRQMILLITDEDIAWTVILRLARELKWKISDPYSGRELKP